jgi:uncharacterized protein YdeI (YjbR/CyaY-like superfamily)
MNTIYLKTRIEWRDWLKQNHDTETKGIWLMFLKKGANQQTLKYEDAVEEALCFGWIDSIIKNIDQQKYVRKFTPRNEKSDWSELNKKRVEKVIRERRMTKYGLAKIEIAKKSGFWEKTDRPQINLTMPQELKDALAKNKKAKIFFDKLALTYQKHFIAWIQTAKLKATRDRRVKESISLLEKNKKLGLK